MCNSFGLEKLSNFQNTVRGKPENSPKYRGIPPFERQRQSFVPDQGYIFSSGVIFFPNPLYGEPFFFHQFNIES